MPKDQRACRYVQKYIHKLPFGVPVGVDALPLSSLPKIMSQLYGNVRQNSRSTIAYKGGIYERDLLARLNIPALDLQDYCCPKTEKLFDQLAGSKRAVNTPKTPPTNTAPKWRSKHLLYGWGRRWTLKEKNKKTVPMGTTKITKELKRIL